MSSYSPPGKRRRYDDDASTSMSSTSTNVIEVSGDDSQFGGRALAQWKRTLTELNGTAYLDPNFAAVVSEMGRITTRGR